jgi:hypothetical protein
MEDQMVVEREKERDRESERKEEKGWYYF